MRLALALWHAWGRCYLGVLEIKRGDVGIGLRQLRDAYNDLGDARFAAVRLIGFHLAELLGSAGQIADGLEVINEALERSDHSDECWAVAELLRVKGELLLLQGARGGAVAAENQFRQALEQARPQGALSWELRAATSLARLLRDQRRFDGAIALLQPVYQRFTEGFETADVKTANALLEALSDHRGRSQD
jgi:predicted ATPase